MGHALRDVSVLIVDDHASTRKFLTTLLEDSGMQVVGEAANGHEGVRLFLQLRPSIVVLDISMPQLNGFGVARKIAGLFPAAKIIFLTGHVIREYVIEALRAGGVGYVFKDHAAHDLPNAIAAALDGKTYVSGKAASSHISG